MMLGKLWYLFVGIVLGTFVPLYTFHCIKYDSLIISTKGSFKKLMLSLESAKNLFFTFINGFTGTTTRNFFVWNRYHSIELAPTFQKSMSYTPLRYKAVKLYQNTYRTRFWEFFHVLPLFTDVTLFYKMNFTWCLQQLRNHSDELATYCLMNVLSILCRCQKENRFDGNSKFLIIKFGDQRN